MRVCMHVCKYMYNIHACTYISEQINKYINNYIHIHICIYMYMYIDIYMPTQISRPDVTEAAPVLGTSDRHPSQLGNLTKRFRCKQDGAQLPTYGGITGPNKLQVPILSLGG